MSRRRTSTQCRRSRCRSSSTPCAVCSSATAQRTAINMPWLCTRTRNASDHCSLEPQWLHHHGLYCCTRMRKQSVLYNKYSHLNGCMCIHAGSYQDTFKQAVKDALYKGLLCPHTNAPPTLTRNPHCTRQRKGQVRFATSSDDEQLHIRIQPSLQPLLKNKSLPSLTSGSRPR